LGVSLCKGKALLKDWFIHALLIWCVLSAAVFVAAVIGFRIIQGNWDGLSFWLPIFAFASVLGVPIGTLLWKLGFSA